MDWPRLDTGDTQMRNPNVDRGLSNEAERLERAQDWDYPALVGVATYPPNKNSPGE